jgi:protein SCO1/2
MALEGLARSLKGFTLSPAQDFDVVTLSFDPREKPELARAKKSRFVDYYGRPGAEEGWHFLTGDEEQIRRVTEAVGFRYRWDEAQKEFAHATGLVVLTPQGVVSRYFFGIEYAPKELRLGLSEASSGKVGGLTAQLLLLCYKYDPAVGKYTTTVMAVLRVVAALTVVVLATFIVVMLRRERALKRPPVGVNA